MPSKDKIFKNLFNSLSGPLWFKRAVINSIDEYPFIFMIVLILMLFYYLAISFASSDFLLYDSNARDPDVLLFYLPKLFYFAIAAVLILVIFFFYQNSQRPLYGIETDTMFQDNLEQRISKIAESMQESTTLIKGIINDIESKKTLANKLQREIEVANLKQSEVEALKVLLGDLIIKEGKKSLWKGILVNLIFFVLGFAATHLWDAYMSK